MRILVTYGSRHGGTAELARLVGERLRVHGFMVDLRPAADATDVEGYDAVIVGGALALHLWHPDALHFVRRNAEALQNVPVWLFSCGPVDSAEREGIVTPARSVARMIERINARGHVTFGREPTARLHQWADSVAEVLRPTPLTYA